MAYMTSQFSDAPVFIYDSKNNLITRTTVTGYNRDEMYIEVSAGLENVKLRSRLNLLIFHAGGASELSGFLKCVRQGLYEISIFGERQREVRTSSRRTLNASAVISDMIADSVEGEIDEPLPITIENMSTSGVLIGTQTMKFDIGTLLQIEFKVGRKTAIIFGEVIREQKQGDGAFKYGCRLTFLD